ncbi:MAG: chemotaxis protein CheB [Cyanosarcina radialis HA8281-LM2]|nr:chemotaxis protein CheB [Cyanosarcina radialis HA8281-LM2]
MLVHFPNVAYHLVAIASSSGGLKAVSTVLSALPAEFPAAIVLVQHMSSLYPSYLPELLNRCTALEVKAAIAGEPIRPGIVYVAVPDKHLLVEPEGTLAFSDAAKANFSRPAADVLFRSVAKNYRSRAIAVVLTGANSDGALGSLAIKKYGGVVIAQDEATSACFKMPKAAIETGKVDLVLPIEAIASTLYSLVA